MVLPPRVFPRRNCRGRSRSVVAHLMIPLTRLSLTKLVMIQGQLNESQALLTPISFSRILSMKGPLPTLTCLHQMRFHLGRHTVWMFYYLHLRRNEGVSL